MTDHDQPDEKQQAGMLAEWLRRPLTGAHLLKFREIVNTQFLALWASLGEMEERVEQLMPVHVNEEGIVQQTISAMERNLGDKVKVSADLRLTRQEVASQLPEEVASQLLTQPDGTTAPAISLKGCEGIVVARDAQKGRILVRLLFTPALLMLFDESEVEVVEDGRSLGILSLQEIE